jgi:hypothetical protein
VQRSLRGPKWQEVYNLALLAHPEGTSRSGWTGGGKLVVQKKLGNKKIEDNRKFFSCSWS